MYYYDFSYFIFMIPALIVSLWAQFKVKSTFSKFSKIKNYRKLTGAQAAQRVLMDNGVFDVRIEHIPGQLNDHYDPRTNIIRLSDAVYNDTSVSSVGVAAHEAGHAVQEARGYFPMKIRKTLVPVTQIGSTLYMPLIIIGFFIPTYYDLFVALGIILFSLVVVFSTITLPVEFDASSRAIKALESGNMLNDEEIIGAKKVLSAAAMTYLAAVFTSLLSLFRLILIYGGRRND